jgi:transcriptional regulator with XRE-family HTH domain
MEPMQCRMARAALDWSSEELAVRSGLPLANVLAFEAGEAPQAGIAQALQAVLGAAGVLFEAAGQLVEGGPGVRLRRSGGDDGKRPDELNSANDG